ncbi:hypothetical protein [Pyrobaculum sp.]|uniref:hypothetical protein n=1 Tax=Pyrobaculum sp. TaxID=2004705 RepID=UPI003D1124A0
MWNSRGAFLVAALIYAVAVAALYAYLASQPAVHEYTKHVAATAPGLYTADAYVCQGAVYIRAYGDLGLYLTAEDGSLVPAYAPPPGFPQSEGERWYRDSALRRAYKTWNGSLVVVEKIYSC